MEYLFTERAHLMCPNMCFGIVTSVNRQFDEARIRETADVLADAHPFLKALLGYEEESNAYFYRITDKSQAEVLIQNEEIAGSDAPEVLEEYGRLAASARNLFKEGMLRIIAWKAREKTVFLLVFDHLLTDGRGAFDLAEELANYYVSGIRPGFAEEKLISSKDDFPADSRMPPVSRFLVNRANREWRREKRIVSYEQYLSFAEEFLRHDPVRHTLSLIEPDGLSEIIADCRRHQVTVNDYLLAKLFLEEDIKKVIIAGDLRDRLDFYHKGALGNYSTAFSVEIRKKENDLFSLAKKIHAAVLEKMNRPSALYLVLQCYAALDPGLLDAALISSRGGFESKAAKFIGTMFFGFGAPQGYSITNLGRLENAAMDSAFFIPPASPAIRKTVGVLTLNGRMSMCTSERQPPGPGRVGTGTAHSRKG